MIRVTAEIRAEVRKGDDFAVFILRRPTNKEINDFLISRSRIDRKNRIVDQSVEARATFFDKLLINVEGLEDAEGVTITKTDLDKIPIQWKADIIFSEFESSEIDLKNF